MTRATLLILAGAALLSAAHNELTPQEKQAGWRLLFDGQTFRGWQDPATKNQPGDAWRIENDTVRTVLKPRIEEDLVSEAEFGDFELTFDWKIAPKGNTGVKYRIQRHIFVDKEKQYVGAGGFEAQLGHELKNRPSDRTKLKPGASGFVYTVGFECQLIDDQGHVDALRGADRRTGALYAMNPPEKSAAKPAGEWNTGRILVVGNNFEHWINGVKVNEGSLTDDAVRAGVSKRWKPAPEILQDLSAPRPRGPVSLQHHSDEAWFRNIKIREVRAK
jgi:hypothetical protein